MTKRDKEITTARAVPAEIIEKVLLDGDLSRLTPEERLHYYKSVCESLGLNPLTKPFDYIILDKKLVLYARKDATEQLRKIHGVSITDLTAPTKLEDVFVVTAKAKDAYGRTDAATGAVASEYTDDGGTTHKIKGVALANLLMKAETKAKRRVTLSICGLGMFDESELDTVTSPPADDSSAIIERNVREAAAHAMQKCDGNHGMPVCADPECWQRGIEPVTVTSEYIPSNEYGPLKITADNYKELKSHVGKAQGNLLGYKVGELHRNVIEWMYKNWRDKLTPSATEQDMRLKKAIEFAYAEGISGGGAAETAGAETRERDPVKPPSDQPEDIGAKQAAITDLRQRIQDLVLTEEQACKYLTQFGLFAEGWTSFNDAHTNLLLHLCTPQGWKTFKELLEKEVKPKVVDKPKKGRRASKR